MANVDLEQDDAMPTSYGAYGSDDVEMQRDIAQRKLLDLPARVPYKPQSTMQKAETAFEKFGSFPALKRLNEEAGARLYGKMTGNGDMVELLNGVPDQYHTSVLDEASKYGALAGYVRRDQILENVKTNSQFDDMSWYAQLGYGALAFVADPLNVLAGAKVIQGAKAAEGFVKGAQAANIINSGVNGTRAWAASGLVSNSAKVGIWAGAGATEGAISNLPQLAADHTYTARDYGLDIMFDSTLGVAFGTVGEAARPLFKTQDYRREIEKSQEELQRNAQQQADPLPPTRLPEEEVEDVGKAVTNANDMLTAVNDATLQKEIDAVSIQIDEAATVLDETATPKAVTELPTDDDYIKILKKEINELYTAWEAEPATEVTDNKRIIRERLHDRYGELHALLDEKKAALGKSQVRQYADLNSVNRISDDGFKTVAATVRSRFENTGIGHLINNQTSLLGRLLPDEELAKLNKKLLGTISDKERAKITAKLASQLPKELRAEAEKLNADIVKLLATVPNGQIPSWLDDSVKQLTYSQKEFTTNNALELAINSSPLQAKETLTQYNDFLMRLDIWDGYDVQPLSSEEFFRDNQAWMNPDVDIDPDVLTMQTYISKELSMLRDVVELNKSLNMIDPEFRAQVERLNGIVTARMEQKVMSNTRVGTAIELLDDTLRMKNGTPVNVEVQQAPTKFSMLLRMEFGEPKVITAKDSSGEVVGTLYYMPNGGPIDVEVKDSVRRQGIGTMLYDRLETEGGKIPDMSSGVAVSKDAEKFRLARSKNKIPTTKKLAHEDIKQIAADVKAELIRMGYVPKTAEFAKRYAAAFERATIDARSSQPEQFKEYLDSSQSWGKTVELTAPDIIKILAKEGYVKHTPEYKARFKELRANGRTEVSAEVNRIGKRQSYEVGTVTEGRDTLDRDTVSQIQTERYDGGDEAAYLSSDQVDVIDAQQGRIAAIVDEPDQGLLPTKFNVVTKHAAYKEPTVESLKRLRESLNNSLTAKAKKLSKTTNRTAFEVQERLEKIESALKAGRKKEAMKRAIASQDLQNVVDLIRVSQTIADEQAQVAVKTKPKADAKPAEPSTLSSALTPDEVDTVDPMSGKAPTKDTQARIDAAMKAQEAKSAAKVASHLINFVQSGKHAALKIALKPKHFTDRIGRLAASWVKDLGQRFVEHDLKSLNYVGYYLTEVGAGFGGKITRPNTAAIIRDAAYKNSVQNMVVDYVATMDKYAKSKGANAVQRMFAQQSAGQDSEIVTMFNKDVFATIQALQSGTPLPKVDQSVTDFVNVWKSYMDKNHEMLLDAQIQGFSRERKINYYMPQIWQSGKLEGAIKQHGYDKVVQVLKKGYLTNPSNGKFNVPDKVAEDNAKGLIDWIRGQANTDTPEDMYMPVIDSRAQERRAINTMAEVDGLSVLDLLDTDVIANGIRYSNRVAGWVGMSKSTNGALTSLRDIDALRANIEAEAAEKGIDATKQVQWYDDVVNMLFGRPTRGGLEQELRMLKDLTALTRMGGLGTAQLIETGQVITRSALNLFSNKAVVDKVLRLGVTPGQAVGGNAEQELMNELQSLSGITDGLEWLDRQSVHLDQHELNQISAVRQVSLQIADTATWRSWKAPASRLLGKTTGYNMVRRFQARLTQASFMSDVANHFKFGTGKMGNARMADVGLTDANGMNAELKEVFEKYVEFAPNRTITKLNIDQWPKQVREQFQYAMLRDEAQMVQRTHVGELPPWMNKPLMGLLFQFREMPMVAMNKQLRRNMAFADKEAVVGTMLNMAFAGLVRWAKFAAIGAGAVAIKDVAWQEPNNEQMDAQKYVAQFGLYPDLYDLVLDTTEAVQDKDVHKVLNQVPVLGLMKDYHDTIREPENRTQIDAAQGLVPLGNTAYGDSIFLWMNEQFGE